jgi:hypothetical protein
LPKSTDAEQAKPALEACFKNRLLAEENRFMETSSDSQQM